MPEPAFLVEGHMEQSIIQRICPGKTVRLIGCNGDGLAISAIVKRLDSQIRLMKNFHPVVIIFDREKRRMSASEIVEEVSRQLVDLKHGGRFIIGVPDREIENWILADWQSVQEKFGYESQLKVSSEGCNGKSTLKSMLPKGERYNETSLGLSLFLSLRATNIYNASESFRSFFDCIDFKCDWLDSLKTKC